MLPFSLYANKAHWAIAQHSILRLYSAPSKFAPRPVFPAPAVQPGHERRRILMVDDHIDGAESLAMLLRLLGHEAHTVHNGPEALVAAGDFQPDLVFLDIGLPGMNGYEVALTLRRNHGATGPMLFALTG